jgi:DNA-binding transcriptional ArsR family regulator
MAEDREPTTLTTEIFKALGDPIRWSIVNQMASVDELACLALEETLPISKPTISYHTKILYHAGLISVRKKGRNYFYSLRRDVLHGLLDSLLQLGPAPRDMAGATADCAPGGTARHPLSETDRVGRQNSRDATSGPDEALVLTW